MAHLRPSRPLTPAQEPKSRSPSSPHEVVSSETLLRHLDEQAPLESQEGRAHKESVMRELNEVLQAWVCGVAVRRGLYPDTDAAREAGGLMLTSGSYKLSIDTRDSDVDVIFVAPRFLSRLEFFDELAPMLQRHPGVTSMLPISEAKTPIIEMEMRGVSIDLQFVALPRDSVPRDLNYLDDNVLQGLDPTSVRSMNGPRVNEMIARLVPNYDAFVGLTRTLRLWAKARGLYNNKMGYLGGINFAILSAYVCQQYPAASPATLVQQFFRIMHEHRWPTPIFITTAYTVRELSALSGGAGDGRGIHPCLPWLRRYVLRPLMLSAPPLLLLPPLFLTCRPFGDLVA